MPIKYLRLGFTESTLLYFYYMNNVQNVSININDKNNMTRWLYTTSGYYDKTQNGNYMNVIHKDNIDPPTYRKYMDFLLNFLKNADKIDIRAHIDNNLNEYKIFKNHLNYKTECYISRDIIYNFIRNKKILIISPFSSLMKQQYESGNLKKIYSNTPEIELILIYKYPYTFFNNGPHNNILETCDYEFNQIINTYDIDSYDSVLISCGAYSNLLAEKFYNSNKNVCTIGGDLQTFFGIANKRTKDKSTKDLNKNNFSNSEFWILDIPEEYKPIDYMKIENGCYW